MSTIPKRVFIYDYRSDAGKLVTEQVMGATEAANKLGLSVRA